MILTTALLISTLAAPAQDAENSPPPTDPIPNARVLSEELGVTRLVEVAVTFENAPRSWWGDPTEVAVSRPILQLDVPEGVALLGAAPTEKVHPRDF